MIQSRTARLAVVFSSVMLAAVPASPQSQFAQIPAEFRGDWVAASAACSAPLRVRIETARVTLLNGADMEAFGGVEMAGPSYFGPDYNGIQTVAITEFEGDQPVRATFNANEKKGVAMLELATPTPGPARGAAATLNAHLQKLNLVKRFPLQQVALKKCPAAK